MSGLFQQGSVQSSDRFVTDLPESSRSSSAEIPFNMTRRIIISQNKDI